MVKSAPPAPFEMSEPDLLLELLIIALDAPAQFGGVDQTAEGDFFWKSREPIFGRRFLALGPFDQQPLFRSIFGEFVTVSDPNPHARKTRGQPLGGAFAPLDRAPSVHRQAKRDIFDRLHLPLGAAPTPRRRARPRSRPPPHRCRFNVSRLTR